MYKRILLFAVLMSSLACVAQKKTKVRDTTHHVTVLYDFFSKDPLKILRTANKTGKNDKLKLKEGDTLDIRKLYYGDKINFRVRVNPFLYDVKINGRNVFENSPLDTAYVNTFLSFFGKGGGKPSTDTKDKKIDDALKDLGKKTSESEVKHITKEDKEAFRKAAGKSKPLTQTEFESLKTTQEERYRLLRTYFSDTANRIDSFFNRFQEEKIMLETVLLLSLADFKEYDSIIVEVEDYIRFMQGDPAFTINELKKSTDFFLRHFQREAKKESNNLRSIFQEMANINRTFEISTFESDSTLFVYYFDLADSLQKENLLNFTRAYTAFLQGLGNRTLFDKTYSPDFAVADSFQFQIELHPSPRARDFISLYKLSLRDTIFKPYTLPVKRYLKLNLSVGLAFMFGSAVPTPYYFSTPKDQLDDDDTVYIKKGKPKSAVIPRIALFTHLYWTNANWVKPAMTFGISTNPADPAETAYIGGMSLIFGQNRRMVVSGGLALANTDVLKPRYKVDEIRKKSFYSGIEETDLTEKKLRFGGFFGISYNF